MKKKWILLIIIVLAWIYPVFSLFSLDKALNAGNGLEYVQEALHSYQASIWIVWIIMTVIAVHYKWTTQRNLFFSITYGFLIVSFIVLGYYTQRMVTVFEVPSNFEDEYTLGVFAAIQNTLVSVILTGFLQAGVWWFTRRWHRR